VLCLSVSAGQPPVSMVLSGNSGDTILKFLKTSLSPTSSSGFGPCYLRTLFLSTPRLIPTSILFDPPPEGPSREEIVYRTRAAEC